TPRPEVAGVTPQPETVPSPEAPARAAESQSSKLRIAIQSEGPEVTVRVYQGGAQLFSRAFRGPRSGLMRKAKPFNAGDGFELPAGIHNLQVLVVPGGKAGRTEPLNANFPAGETRTLVI